ARAPRSWERAWSLEIVLGPAHEVNEDVLERGIRARPDEIRPIAVGRNRSLERRLVAPAHMQAGAEGRDHVDARTLAQLLGKLCQPLAIARAHRIGVEMRSRDHLVDRAVREQRPGGDVGALVAALGFVHVVRGDEAREAVPRERMDLVPELASRLRIDARGRLVEEEKLRVRQRTGPERKPLFPTTRELAGKLRLATLESEPLDHRARRRRRVGNTVEACDEFQVLAHRKILVEAEALRHVAYVTLDLVRLGADVVAEAGAATFVRREQPAQHPDGRGLARAVGTQEAVDFPALDPH